MMNAAMRRPMTAVGSDTGGAMAVTGRNPSDAFPDVRRSRGSTSLVDRPPRAARLVPLEPGAPVAVIVQVGVAVGIPMGPVGGGPRDGRVSRSLRRCAVAVATRAVAR